MAEFHRVICYAHRGARAHAPENTLLAFSTAFDVGADGIECDVQLTRDQRLVVIHDRAVNRTTNGRGPVCMKTLAQLRDLDAGWSWRLPQRIPLLEEVLQLVQRRGGCINLEVKGDTPKESIVTAKSILPLLEELPEQTRSRVLVSSFEHSVVALLIEQLPWLRVGVLYGNQWRGHDLVAPALALGAEAIHPEVSLLTEECVAEAHEASLQVNVWTANSWMRIRRLLKWGVDGIFSDNPERVVILRAVMLSDAADGNSVSLVSSVPVGKEVVHSEVEE